jgi:pimeloyl-ACP methyl ester carboxylesterase
VELFPDEVYPTVPAALRARYDIVTFDPRGFGHSTAIRCFSSVAAENAFFAGLPAFPVGPAQQAAWERTFARFDALCGERNGSLLDHDTSADDARDMDLLRQAVHDPAMNYYGISYGTGIGEVYANLFPGRVGHMLLDASFDPVTWSSRDGALPLHLRDGAAQAAARGMNGFLTLCGQAGTSACAFSAGSPAATRAKWNALLARLLRHPVTIGSPAQTITYADVIAASPPQQSAQWPQEAAQLQQAWAASGTGTATASSSAAMPASINRGNPAGSGPAAPGSRSPANGAGIGSPALSSAYDGAEQSLALACADSSNPRNPGRYPAIAASAAARFGGFGALATWTDEPCAQWPGNGAQDRYTGPWNRRTANPILVFGNTGDVAINYQDSVAAARDLGDARLLTINQFGHTEALNPDTCATNYEVSYLLTKALPPAGTVCQADAPPFPAS